MESLVDMLNGRYERPSLPAQQQHPTQVLHGTSLDPEDVCIFKPTEMPDLMVARDFIDGIRDAVSNYGEASTLAVLPRCCQSTVARRWVMGMTDLEKLQRRDSTDFWIRKLREDFFPPPEILKLEAWKEHFTWDQGRSPVEYATNKTALLRMAGETNEDTIVTAIHKGFIAESTLYLALFAYVKTSDNSASEFRRHIVSIQDSAKRLHEEKFGPPRWPSAYTSRTQPPTRHDAT